MILPKYFSTCLLILRLSLSCCLLLFGASAVFGQTSYQANKKQKQASVFHYLKPDWWSSGLWPNGLKLRYGYNDYYLDMAKELNSPDYTGDTTVKDDSVQVGVGLTHSQKLPVMITLPESVFGKWGPILFFGQAFFDIVPNFKSNNQGVNVGSLGANWTAQRENLAIFLSEDDLNKCESLPGFVSTCHIAWDLEVRDTFMFGYSIGAAPVAIGNSRFFKISFGIGMTYMRFNMDLSLCSYLDEESYTKDGKPVSGYCRDKTRIDHFSEGGFIFSTTFTMCLYEYMGENFGLTLISVEKGSTPVREVHLGDHTNLEYHFKINDFDIVAMSFFF